MNSIVYENLNVFNLSESLRGALKLKLLNLV